MNDNTFFAVVIVLVFVFLPEPNLLDAVTNYINRAGCQP